MQHLVGTRLLVGVTVLDDAGAVANRRQFHGTVTEVADGVVVLAHPGGELLLPADPDAFSPARPGEYRLASGEVVVDPDYLSVWTVAPGDGPEGDGPQSDSSQRSSNRAP